MAYVFHEDDTPLNQREVNVKYVLQQAAFTLEHANRVVQLCQECINTTLGDINATIEGLSPPLPRNHITVYRPQFAIRADPRSRPYGGGIGMGKGRGCGKGKGSGSINWNVDNNGKGKGKNLNILLAQEAGA